jgi:hypothetical protein
MITGMRRDEMGWKKTARFQSILAGLVVVVAFAATGSAEEFKLLSQSQTRQIVGLINAWAMAASQCRTGDPALRLTLEACTIAHQFQVRLDDLGWCHGRESDPGGLFFRRWHRCDSDSFHPKRP